jgi:broad specificity phosphatase PhoE
VFLRSVDRLHDPKLESDVHPEEAAGLLMLDLGISIKNSHKHNVLIISSPFQTCLQTAVITCQQFGVSSFYVNYSMGESMIGKLASGWDWGCVPLYLQPFEMDDIVAKQSREGERKSRNRVYIEGYLGEKQSMETRNETKMNFSNRITDNLDQIRSSLVNPRDHVIVVSHADVLEEFALKYGNIEVLNVQHNSFMTFCIPSDNTAWLLGRSRVQIVPK